MILYHTSDREIVNPDIHYGRKNDDFGWGFYLTPDKDFTYRWARENAVVNVYELDEEDLDIHTFKRDTEWFRYIFGNRRVKDTLASDVIIGPIANDTLFDTYGIITSGYLNDKDALRLLMIGPQYTQVAIKTEKAVSKLCFIKSEKIQRIDPVQLKKEQEDFRDKFAGELNSILD